MDLISLALINPKLGVLHNLEFEDIDKYSSQAWRSYNHNTGLLLTKPFWRLLKKLSNVKIINLFKLEAIYVIIIIKEFCTYDDYNWDWTLNHIASNILDSKLRSYYPVDPRVVHIGEW